MKAITRISLATLSLAALFTAHAADEAVREKTDFEKSITRNLVRLEEGKLKRVDPDSIQPKDYYAIYYSAHWCPPCRKFTPKLVNFYNEAIGHHDNIEIIFVSSDQDEDKMESYMEKTDMRWLALDFDKKDNKSSKELTGYVGRGIPHLVVIDKNGKILSDSVVDGDYVGPYKVLEDFIDLIH
ncbi:MAG: thioredoxin-like domain-containing protein [Coraliomargaritaceae bacterium]